MASFSGLTWIKPPRVQTRFTPADASERFRGGDSYLKEAIYSRRSVREFTAETVSEKIIRDLIEAAVQAPSAARAAMHILSSSFGDKTVLATISQEAKAHMVKTTPIGLMSHHFKEVLNDPNFNIFYNAPVLILISTIGDIPWAVEDCALAAENLMPRRVAPGSEPAHRLCPIVARNARGQSAPQTSGELQAGRTDHRSGHPKAAQSPIPRKEPEIRWVEA